MNHFFISFPRWTFSIVCLLILIWLLAAPTPYMEFIADRVSNNDHLCHMIMGAGMVFCLFFDWQRKHHWQFLRLPQIGIMALVAFVITGLLEISQALTPEEYRRWFEVRDLLWQLAGITGMGVLYYLAQSLWSAGYSQSRFSDL